MDSYRPTTGVNSFTDLTERYPEKIANFEKRSSWALQPILTYNWTVCAVICSRMVMMLDRATNYVPCIGSDLREENLV